jgi:predicted nucleic acid-binding protein
MKNSTRIEAYTSSLAISEAVSEMMRIAEKEKTRVDERDVENIVRKLVEYCNVKILNEVEMDDLVLLALYKIDAKDSLHLEISKRNNMILVTDDVELKERGKYFYSKIMGFYEFAKMVKIINSKFCTHSQVE